MDGEIRTCCRGIPVKMVLGEGPERLLEQKIKSVAPEIIVLMGELAKWLKT
jgi:hypothetical protein